MPALEETKTGAGEKLTSSDAVEIETPEFVAAKALGTTGAATGLGAGLGAGFAAGLGAGFWSAAGTPFLIGESKLTTLAGAGLGFGAGFDTGAFASGALVAGALATGSFVVVETVRVAVTDFAQTVTEVAPVLDE